MNAMNFLFLAAAGTMLVLLGVIFRQFRGQFQRRDTIARLETIRDAQAQEIADLKSKLHQRDEQIETLTNDRNEARESQKLAQQQLQHEKLAREDWQKQKEEFEKAARASVLQAGQELSNKLLTDHKRESQELRESFQKDKQQENVKIKEYLLKLQERLATNEEIAQKTSNQYDVLWRTFSSPSSTGQLAEVGLENLLKNMGLRAGLDFKMQYTVGSGEGSGLRPDCVIKLPNNRLVVIDCKASKHVLAMAQARGTEEEEQENQRFLTTMREHFKALSRKDYINAIAQEDFLNKRDLRTAQVVNVMYVPSSAAVELLHSLDPDLIDRSEKHGIILIGPGMLPGLISLISKEISDERKLENQERIIDEVERLLGALASTFGHIGAVGRQLKTLTTSFGKISGSFNKQIAPKLRNLDTLGIRPQGTKQLPNQLESYELRSLSETIELESEQDDADTHQSLEDYRKERA